MNEGSLAMLKRSRAVRATSPIVVFWPVPMLNDSPKSGVVRFRAVSTNASVTSSTKTKSREIAGLTKVG